LGFIDEFVPLSGLLTCSLATLGERDKDLIFGDIILVEETHSAVAHPAVSDVNKSDADPVDSIPTLYDSFTLIITGTHPNRTHTPRSAASRRPTTG